MKSFKFNNQSRKFESDENVYIAHIGAGLRTKMELLSELVRSLNLPNYFGYNWDALEECLRDFHWLEEKTIIIEHEKLPELSEGEMKLYLDILLSAMNEWTKCKSPFKCHVLEVTFPPDEEPKIKKLLSI